MKSCFRVIAKFGHVGRNKYYEGTVYVQAQSAKEAALLVRWMPRVKHHHKDAILSVEEVSQQEFCEGQATMNHNPYFACSNIQQQRARCGEMSYLIKSENNHYDDKSYCSRRKRALLYKLQRKLNKHKAICL